MTSSTSRIDRLASYLLAHMSIHAALVLVLLCGLPLAVWLDLRNLSEHSLRAEADEFGTVIDGVRGFYASSMVGRVLAAQGDQTRAVHNYLELPGAIPIPATFSLELARVIGDHAENMRYRFVSDLHFSTGFCNVGNFGSNDRMDYTIIGAEANLAARLQAIAELGGIVASYETFALVRDMVRGRPRAARASAAASCPT